MPLFKWFSDNQMKANLDKCHLPINERYERETNIADSIKENRKMQKTTGNKVDSKHNFKVHVEDQWKTAS